MHGYVEELGGDQIELRIERFLALFGRRVIVGAAEKVETLFFLMVECGICRGTDLLMVFEALKSRTCIRSDSGLIQS